jgi:hypothetical protein
LRYIPPDTEPAEVERFHGVPALSQSSSPQQAVDMSVSVMNRHQKDMH